MTPAAPALSLSRPRTADTDKAQHGLALGICLIGLALTALILLQYALPPRTDAHYWGLDPEGLRQFGAHWGLSRLPQLSVDSFSLAFRLLLVTSLVGVCAGGSVGIARRKTGGTACAGRALSARRSAWPCSARRSCPMTCMRMPRMAGFLRFTGRTRTWSARRFWPRWAIPSRILSPGTGRRSMARSGRGWKSPLSACSMPGGLWPQVVALKLVQAGALIGMALAGRRIAGHLCPGRENLTLLAIGLNPMLLAGRAGQRP